MTEPNTPQNYMRFRVSPEITIALAVSVSSPTGNGHREALELIASRHPRPDEMEAYERVLGDAMAGDATLFARQDYVEEAWRIVDPVLKATTPVYVYEPHTWGPQQVEQSVVPPGGWDTPQEEEVEDFRIIGQPK
jgi:glucose-6-phosphate 1-dehydrogenase